ncbi:MAG TPA: GNAT family N-acetyltransferase [Coxiellaceae bacterium]|nr:GNAT family N-acetyltransferase [Coxiellaceae bacterium]
MITDAQYRYAKPDDLHFIYQSLKAMVEEQNIQDRFSQTADSLAEALFSDHPLAEVLLAELDGKLVGFCLFSLTNRNFDLFNAPGIYIHEIYTVPAYRHQGVARDLIKRMKAIAKERGCGRIDWVVLKDNQPAMEFYKKVSGAVPVDYIDYMRIKIEA